MSKVTIYHNPRCSKSRQALQLLYDKGIEPVVVEYLKNPPNEQQLKDILKKLQLSARELIRAKEDIYETLNLSSENITENELIQAMVENPKLIERPIVITGKKAVIGRPTEKINEILN